MQKALAIHYEETPSVTLWYPNQLEAYRSDRFDNFTKQPTDGGAIANQVGYWGYTSVEPVSEAESDSGGIGTGGWIGIGAAVIVVLGGGGWLLSRRKGSDDRE